MFWVLNGLVGGFTWLRRSSYSNIASKTGKANSLCTHKWNQKNLRHQVQPEAKDSQLIWRAWNVHHTRAAAARYSSWFCRITRCVRHHMERIWFCLMKTSKITFKKVKGKHHILSDASSIQAIFCSLPEKESLLGLSVFRNLCLRSRSNIPAYSEEINHKETLGLIFARILSECTHEHNLELETRSLWC